jgi:hypothetical protein
MFLETYFGRGVCSQIDLCQVPFAAVSQVPCYVHGGWLPVGSAELAQVHDHVRTEAMLLDSPGRWAEHDVICEKHNLLESDFSMLKP